MSLLSPSSESQSPNEMVLIPRIILPYPFKPQKLRGLQVAKSIVAILFAFLQNPLYFVPPHLWILHSRTEPVLHKKWYVEGVIKPLLETLISHTGVCDFEPWLCFSYNFLAIHTLGEAVTVQTLESLPPMREPWIGVYLSGIWEAN